MLASMRESILLSIRMGVRIMRPWLWGMVTTLLVAFAFLTPAFASAPGPTEQVPEPGTLILAGSGIAAAWVAARMFIRGR